MKSLVPALAIAGLLAIPTALLAETTTAYFVGNSVTDTINYSGLAALAAQRDHTQVWGRHMIPGAPLAWLWQHPNDGFRENNQAPAGQKEQGFGQALPGYAWNFVSLQPFDRQLGTVAQPVPTTPGTFAGPNADIQDDTSVARGFIDQALKNAANADTQFYIYSRWPRRDAGPDSTDANPTYLPFDFQAKWDRTYTGGWDGTNESRDYFKRLLDNLNTAYPTMNKPIRLVPVGDVLYELDKRMEAGQVPGYTDVAQLYSDGIHFNNVGSFVVGTTYYATFYKDDPTGLTVPTQYGTIDPLAVAALQDAVWDVVSTHADTGVNVPEPGAMLLPAAGAAFALLRKR